MHLLSNYIYCNKRITQIHIKLYKTFSKTNLAIQFIIINKDDIKVTDAWLKLDVRLIIPYEKGNSNQKFSPVSMFNKCI